MVRHSAVRSSPLLPVPSGLPKGYQLPCAQDSERCASQRVTMFHLHLHRSWGHGQFQVQWTPLDKSMWDGEMILSSETSSQFIQEIQIRLIGWKWCGLLT